MYSRIQIILAGLAVAVSCIACQAQQTKKVPALPLALAQGGKTAYVIVLAADAIPAEKTAARELSEYLQKISGAKFPVENERAVSPGRPQILVGAGIRTRKLMPNQNWDALGSDGIVIKTVGKNLILAGGRPRGSLYAVCSFLEDTLGVRWWAPSESTVPKQSMLRIPLQNVSYTPQLRTREAFYNSVQKDPVFATRLKINGHYQTQTPEWGGHNAILGFVHTFDQLLPPEKYFKDHPEWYSDIENGGKPCTSASRMPAAQKSQICLSNEAARLELTKNALEWIRKNPEAGMISISQNDNLAKCNAPGDLAVEEREGSPAGPLLEFVNAVAADIEKEYPRFLVETLAYLYTRKPPRFVRPRKNVVIRLCSFEADVSRPLNSEANAEFRDDVLGWKVIAPRLYIWDYVANFTNVIMPHPNLPVFSSNVRFFAANNTIALFEQGDAYSNGTGDFVALRVWLLSHLMWNPKLDQKKLGDEFLRGYYGAAAPHLRLYLDTINSAFAKTGAPLSLLQTDYSYLTLDTMNAATRSFRKAAEAVACNETLSRRVRRERLALDHAWIIRYKILKREAKNTKAPFEGPVDLPAFITDFVATARTFKAERRDETQPFEAYAQQLLDRAQALRMPAGSLPDFARNAKEDDLIVGPLRDFRYYGLGKVVTVVDDTAASSGRAAKMIGNTNEWAVQYWLDESDDFLKNGLWHCYAVVRVQAKANAAPGPALNLGIYDLRNKKEVAAIGKNLADVGGSEYKIVDMGKHVLNAQMYLYAAPPYREDIEGVFVDRFILVRENK